MRGSRTFCQRGSNFGKNFLVYKGKEGKKNLYYYKRAIIGRPAKHHLIAFQGRANDGPILNDVRFFRGSGQVPFLDLNLSITNVITSSKIYDQLDDFNFEIVNFPFLDGDVPRAPSYGVYISQLIRFARVCSNVDDFNNRNFF